MRGSTASRRVSEFVGVALFAASLIWVIALASYDPKDPAWFFSTAANSAPINNFAGRIGAFVAELSFQLFGYASYFIPALLVTIGWNYFWCRSFDAAATKATGATLLIACLSALLSLIFGTLEVAGKAFRAGGSAGDWVARLLSEYLNRTGSMIVILTLIFLAVIVSTQFSFGTLFAALTHTVAAGARGGWNALCDWREKRRLEQQRRAVIAKQARKGAPRTTRKAPVAVRASEPQLKRAKVAGLAAQAGEDEAHASSSKSAPTVPALVRAAQTAEGQPAGCSPAALGSRADHEGAGRAPQGRLRAAAARPARRTEDRTENRRA